MKQFISFVRKEFYHIFRDLRTMLILLGMPVVQIILFGFAITTEVKNVKVAVLDFSKDVSTRQIIDKLDASDYFNVNKILYDNNEIEETLRKSSSDLIIVFEAGFDNNLRHTGKARVTDSRCHRSQQCYHTDLLRIQYYCRLSAKPDHATTITHTDYPPNKVIVQSGYAKRLQFCAGSNGIDFNVDMRHDDFHLYCP